MRIRFEQVSVRGEKSFRCTCGRRRRLRKTFWQTLNPYNWNDYGRPRTREEIQEDLINERRAWLARAEPCSCRSAEEMKR